MPVPSPTEGTAKLRFSQGGGVFYFWCGRKECMHDKLDPFYYCAYNKNMEIIFDHIKDTANIAKHGVSLILAADLEWDTGRMRVETMAKRG